MKNFQSYTHVARKFPGILAAVVSMIPLLVETAAAGGPLPASAPATVSVFAIGRNNPRGLKFGPDGNLHVSNLVFGPPIPGVGQVLKIELAD